MVHILCMQYILSTFFMHTNVFNTQHIICFKSNNTTLTHNYIDLDVCMTMVVMEVNMITIHLALYII